MKEVTGFVLMVVLLFLQIFSLLGLLALSGTVILFKANRDSWVREVQLVNTKRRLHAIVNNLSIEHLGCLIATTPAAELAKKSIDWWRQVACSDNFAGNQYDYVVEFLGEDPCGEINHAIAAYYRLSLVFLSGQVKPVILQTTLAIASQTSSTSCLGKKHQAIAGQQMWREL